MDKSNKLCSSCRSEERYSGGYCRTCSAAYHRARRRSLSTAKNQKPLDPLAQQMLTRIATTKENFRIVAVGSRNYKGKQ